MACSFAVAAPAADVTAQLKSPRTSIRARAAQDVIDHRATASGDALNAAAAAEAIPEVRIRLLTASYEVDSSSAVPFLIAALRGDKSPMVRAVAAQILARAPADAKVRKAFLDGLANDADLDVRRACAMGLGFQPHAESLKALTAAAADPDPELRRRAGLALTRHPKSAARDRALDQLENDRDPAVAARVHAERRARGAATP